MVPRMVLVSSCQHWNLFFSAVVVIVIITDPSAAMVKSDFSDEGLTSIPTSGIPSNTTDLLLQNNPLQTIPGGIFQGLSLSDIDSVNLQNTELTDDGLTRTSFSGLEATKKVQNL